MSIGPIGPGTTFGHKPRRLLLETRIPTIEARTKAVGIVYVHPADVDGSALLTGPTGAVRIYFPPTGEVEARCGTCPWEYRVDRLDVGSSAMDTMLGAILDHMAAEATALGYPTLAPERSPLMDTKYPVEAPQKDLDNRFTYHAPKGDQQQRYEAIRAKQREFAQLIVGMTPISREQALALTNLEQAGFWANAAIARNE